jgi:hypothetical protein
MAKYLLKFNENCCPPNKVNYVTSFTFTPSSGSGASISSIENTIFAGNVTDYVVINGVNLVDGNGDINGDLVVEIQCLDWCKLSFWNNLFPVQIGGFGLAIPSPEKILAVAGGNCITGAGNRLVNILPFAVPLGEDIKIQLFGGVGNVRFARTDNRNIASVNSPIFVEAGNFRPEMKTLAPNQVAAGDFVLDRDLGQGGHIVTIKAEGIGKTLVTFTDEAGCFYVMGIHVKPNLCEHNATGKSTVGESEDGTDDTGAVVDSRKGNVYYEGEKYNGNDEDLDKEHGGFCHDCGLTGDEEEVNGDLPMSLPVDGTTTNGFTKLGNIYDNDDFVRGTRSLDLGQYKEVAPKGSNMPIKPSRIYELRVGESMEIDLPDIGGKTHLSWDADVIQWSENIDGNGTARGAGWSEESFGPTWSRFNSPESNIVSTRRVGRDKMKFTCHQPTNFLPTTVHVSPRQEEASSFGGPIPKIPKKIIVNDTEAGAIAKYTSHATGSTKFVHAQEEAAERVSMTNSDFFVGVRCFCPEVTVDIDNLQSIYEAGDEIILKTDIEGAKIDLGDGKTAIALLPKNRRIFLTKESVGGMGKFKESNPITNPAQDDIAPTVGPEPDALKSFKIQVLAPNGTMVWMPIQVFISHTTAEATPLDIHKPSFDRFNEEVHGEPDEFYYQSDENAASKQVHAPSILAQDLVCYQDQGNTIQTRGTWCISNANLIAKFPKPLPVIKSNIDGEAKALRGTENQLLLKDIRADKMLLDIKKIKKKSNMVISTDGVGGPGIRG